MKFAKELERDLVPEWRLAYLNYKLGKKKLKGIQRALRSVNQTPRLRLRGVNTFTPSPDESAPQYAFLNRDRRDHETLGDLRTLALMNSRESNDAKQTGSTSSVTPQHRSGTEQQPLNTYQGQRPGMTRYGSITSERGRPPPSLKLPGAAMDVDQASSRSGPSAEPPVPVPKAKTVRLPPEIDDGFDDIKKNVAPRNAATLPARYKSVFRPKRINTTPGKHVSEAPRPLFRRVFSMGHHARPTSPAEVPTEAYRELDIRQADFFQFLDAELEKIEKFYKQKEDEATSRLNVLREQLHIMRDRRLDELIARQAARIKAKEKKKSAAMDGLMNAQHSNSSEEDTPKQSTNGKFLNHALLSPLDTALEAVKLGKSGKTTKAMTDLATPTALAPQMMPDARRDFERRPDLPDVPYQTARRKLKVALQEYYRGLELLKSYALLNRTAFRKINKKYDKTVNARPTMRFMTEKVNDAWFVKSDVVESHIRMVEDLYARYFERGNHKVAVGKLRVKMARAGDFTEHSFRNGITLAAGAIFGIQGLVYGIQLLMREVDDDDDDARLHVNTSYLLQIYGGYFLMNFLFLLFCLACRIWHECKINYVFVFEYDTRHHLDWRQLSELPCFYFFLLGLFMWLNFSEFGGEAMYHYWPVILLSITAVILILPLPILYFRSRQWILYSMWRLLLAGLYPVEFRDFYLGDMFCSLTYAMGNIELFFCLYAGEWNNPPQCNSSHSRLLGFFTTLPGIWRAFQCLRRYYDTRNVFPHLVNCGKYAATIIFYVALSIYRINKTDSNRAIFITFAVINSIYTSIWDVIMDWSLGDPYAPSPFLRPTLGYKRTWPYYTAMIIDPILRFNWIPYAVDPLQLQHSAVTSFVVAFSEVCRRGMWSLFRVENEHCTNVGRFRASRDVPLPYDIPSKEVSRRESEEHEAEVEQHRHPAVADHEAQAFHHAHNIGSGRRRGSSNLTAKTALGTGLHAPALHHASTFGTPAELEDQISRERTRSTLRRQRANSDDDGEARTSGAAPVVVPSPLTRGLSRVGTLLRDAHAQDFERKKKPELGGRRATGFGKGAQREQQEMDEEEEDDSDEDVESGERSSGNASGVPSSNGEDEDPRRWSVGGDGVGEDGSVGDGAGGVAGGVRGMHGVHRTGGEGSTSVTDFGGASAGGSGRNTSGGNTLVDRER